MLHYCWLTVSSNASKKWVSSPHSLVSIGQLLVAEKAKSSIQLWGYFSNSLSADSKDHYYSLPSQEDRFTIFNGTICYAKLYLVEVYLQVKAMRPSRTLLMINTHHKLLVMNTELTGVDGAYRHDCELVW